jgi:hypothetical protein
MLAPIFKLSYRTRGGFNPISVNNKYFDVDFSPKTVLPQKEKEIRNFENNQITLFSQLNFIENEIDIDNGEE